MPKNWVTCLNLTAFLDGELSPSDAQRFRDHLAVCQICESRLGDQMQIITQLSSLGPRRAQPRNALENLVADYFVFLDRYRDYVAGEWPAETIGIAGENLNRAETELRQALIAPIASVGRMAADLGADGEPPSGWKTKVWDGVRKTPGRWRRMWNWLLDKE